MPVSLRAHIQEAERKRQFDQERASCVRRAVIDLFDCALRERLMEPSLLSVSVRERNLLAHSLVESGAVERIASEIYSAAGTGGGTE